MKGLTILLFATVIASSDAAQKCEEVTDPCASVRADAAPIYENANNVFKEVDDRCTPLFEAVEPRPASDELTAELSQILLQCSRDMEDDYINAFTGLGELLGIDPPQLYLLMFLNNEREGLSRLSC
ncbi:CLUMA_CG020464, isoform A [Clunio marinus]|uniref:CLUMA_CG020464, isoform A n=1 Tax=Clunio marinus TaxID=568069 RepID=A0A1J1J671_9DIPT|nr:CLUMA_CG020464, isoform A [Clunio marinus]